MVAQIEKTEGGHLAGTGEDVEALESFFQEAAPALEDLNLYPGHINYKVIRFELHDQEHNGHGEWTFACLRNEVHHHLVFSDKQYVLTLELEDHLKGHSLNLQVYSPIHFDEIYDALRPLADKLSEETGRTVNLRRRQQQDVPDILSC